MHIYYLEHSGFCVDTEARSYVFDYYKDAKNIIEKKRDNQEKIWFFVSHVHYDHFDKRIVDLGDADSHYFFHKDVPLTTNDEIHYHSMDVGDTICVDGVTVTMYGSTDEGGSFLVNDGKERIFHSGDLNWWHWLGDTPENQLEAKRFQEEQFKPLEGLAVDVAMFPVDARLEAAREWGLIEFLRIVNTKLCIPMHANGSVWEPSEYIRALFPNQQYWIPIHVGDELEWTR